MQCKGDFFEMLTVPVAQVRLDSGKVREILTPDQVQACSKEIRYEQVKTTRHNGAKPKFVMPSLANATPEGLVDMLGDVREQIKDLQKYEGIYKEALVARLNAAKTESE